MSGYVGVHHLNVRGMWHLMSSILEQYYYFLIVAHDYSIYNCVRVSLFSSDILIIYQEAHWHAGVLKTMKCIEA